MKKNYCCVNVGVIETVNDELKNICQVEHTRHRSIAGFILNIMSTIAAYSFFPKKPSIKKDIEETNPVPGSVFLLSPGEVHDWHFSKNIDGYIFFHTREFYDLNFTYEKVDNFPFFCCLRNYPLIPLRHIWREDIERIFSDIVEEYHHNELLKLQKIASLVNVLYIALSRIYLPKTMMDKQNLNYLTKLKKLENLLEKHFKEIKYPKDYAQMMHLSEKHLNRICKTCLDKTTSEVIIDRIVLEAKRLLVFSRFTVSQISDELVIV